MIVTNLGYLIVHLFPSELFRPLVMIWREMWIGILFGQFFADNGRERRE